jgi:hypothetical protein
MRKFRLSSFSLIYSLSNPPSSFISGLRLHRDPENGLHSR